MVRANRYGSVLPAGGGRARLVLVDDLPNVIAYRKEEFYDVLRRYSRGARSPCVFVMSDGAARSDLGQLSVFPDSVQAELGVQHITFRPLTQKQLVTAMERILAVEASGAAGVRHPGRPVLDQLAAAASGDVRAAVNALQFVCVQGGQRRRAAEPAWQAQKRLRTEEPAVGGRDASLGLFRAVGKIIYAKRGDGEEPALPPSLADQRRAPLLERQPEEVCERAGVQPDTLVAHLHHNYPDFCGQLEDAVTSATYISHADLMAADWQSRAAMLAYGSSVAARGVMFARQSSVSLGFRQFSQPQLTRVEQRRLRRLEGLRLALADWRVTTESLVTELLPFLELRAAGRRPGLLSLPEHDISFYRSLHLPVMDSAGCAEPDQPDDELNIEEYAD
ncbi:cell cycle checkpoint protein RAD17-like [Pollicipes pollicipes]|uniref:cell cycle checkpoint protein RAD17-like n=1 Tax=Pollicipes pollicipes TaxID=41117 RepID=UPI0018850FF6|nr:cell cycle checkpoint protein RAD17-like [Pollicipes pollicipes]